LSYGTDFDLWVRLTTRGRLSNLLDPLAQYRVHSENTTHTLRSAAKETGIVSVVARSIQLLGRQIIDLEVANVLTRDFHKSASTQRTLELAFDTIGRCLGCFIESVAQKRRERQTIVDLAIDDFFRIANRNCGSLGLAQMKALGAVMRYHPYSLVKRRYAGIVAEKILPSSVVMAAKRRLRAT
jgi:hypothetical protein